MLGTIGAWRRILPFSPLRSLGEIDLNCCVERKQFHDVVSHYIRFDIFSVSASLL